MSNNNENDLKEIEEFKKSQKKLYFTKLEDEMISLLKIVKRAKFKEVYFLEFSLDADTNEPYLFVYAFDENNDLIDGLTFDDNISLNGDDINYLMNNGVNFEFEINIKQPKEKLLLNLAKKMLGETKGDYWYHDKKSKKLFEEFKEIIPEIKDIKVVKKSKI